MSYSEMPKTPQQEVLSVSATFEQILKRPGLTPSDVLFLQMVWGELGRANVAIGVLLANIRDMEETTGEKLDGDDAVIINQIEAERKPYLAHAIGDR